jgi:hypothetical protein
MAELEEIWNAQTPQKRNDVATRLRMISPDFPTAVPVNIANSIINNSPTQIWNNNSDQLQQLGFSQENFFNYITLANGYAEAREDFRNRQNMAANRILNNNNNNLPPPPAAASNGGKRRRNKKNKSKKNKSKRRRNKSRRK